MENNIDPDQLASLEASWSGSTLFSLEDIFGFSRTGFNTCPVESVKVDLQCPFLFITKSFHVCVHFTTTE